MANLYPVFLVLLILEKAFSKTTISLTCTAEFCDEYVKKFPCPPLDPACSNPNISLIIPSPTPCNCCEHCFIFQDLGENCVVGRPGQPLPKIMCKPGTTCVKEQCVKMTGTDPDFYRGYECTDGKCQCAVIEEDKQEMKKKFIFGTFEETNDITKEQQCGCSKAAYLAKKSINNVLLIPDTFVPTARCLPNGQFDPLQCIDNFCGCVNRSTGFWDTSVRKVFISTLGPNNPKCFNLGTHKTGQYYKACEKERNNLMTDLSRASSGEINVLLSHRVECTPDGEYATRSYN